MSGLLIQLAMQLGSAFSIERLAQRTATQFYERFRGYIQIEKRDTSEYGLGYLSGLLRMETKHNLVNFGERQRCQDRIYSTL